MKTSTGLLSFSSTFKDEDACIKYFEKKRWGDTIVSPYDPTSKVYKCKNNKYRCKNTGRYFDVRTGTIFANSKLSLRTWFFGMFLMLNYKRGISSHQLAKELEITQKTAWNMMQKIRKGMNFENEEVLNGEIEIDETFVGGKNKNRHKDKKVEKCQGRSFKDKTPVFGMLQRDGKLVAKVVSDTQSATLVPLIYENVKEGSIIYTDGWSYDGINGSYNQRSVDHSKKFYASTYVTDDGEIVMLSTNGIENAWSHFKRSIIGVYYHVSKKYLQRYIDEFVLRFNTRKITNIERFNLYLSQIA